MEKKLHKWKDRLRASLKYHLRDIVAWAGLVLFLFFMKDYLSNNYFTRVAEISAYVLPLIILIRLIKSFISGERIPDDKKGDENA